MKKTSLIVVLAMISFGAYIGWDQESITSSAIASQPAAPIFTERPTNFDPLNLRLDLKSGELTVDGIGNKSIYLDINTADAKQPESKTIEIEKEVYVENVIKSTRFMSKFMPMPPATPPDYTRMSSIEGADRKEVNR